MLCLFTQGITEKTFKLGMPADPKLTSAVPGCVTIVPEDGGYWQLFILSRPQSGMMGCPVLILEDVARKPLFF